MAAVLACGKGAVLSHRSAASLWGLLRVTEGPVDVSTPSRTGRRKRTDIHLHRCPSLASGPVPERRGIPVTTPARTIADLRSVVPAWQWRRAVRQAEFAGYRLDIETDGTRSDPEGDFLRLCRRYRLPAPEVNVRVGRWTVDFLWRSHRVAVETDSYGYHRGSIAFEDDHARDLDLHTLGIDVRRFTCRQIDSQPGRVAAAVREALGMDPADH
jgi:very-short-patch-repair endonuclease